MVSEAGFDHGREFALGHGEDEEVDFLSEGAGVDVVPDAADGGLGAAGVLAGDLGDIGAVVGFAVQLPGAKARLFGRVKGGARQEHVDDRGAPGHLELAGVVLVVPSHLFG